MCPDQSQAFKEVNDSLAFTVGRKIISLFFLDVPLPGARRCFSLFILDEPLPGASRCLCKVSRKFSKNWLRRTNIKSNLTPKIEYTLKPSNYDNNPCFLHFTAQNPTVHAVLEGWGPEILHTCLMRPCRAFDELLLFFFAGNVESLKTQISGETKEKKKEPETPFVKGSADAHWTRVQEIRA